MNHVAQAPSQSVNITPPWLDPKGAATYTGFSVATLATWRSVGGGPAYCKAGSRIRYELAALNAWVFARGTFTSTSQYGQRATTTEQ